MGANMGTSKTVKLTKGGSHRPVAPAAPGTNESAPFKPVVCPAKVDKRTWLGPETYEDVFLIVQSQSSQDGATAHTTENSQRKRNTLRMILF